MASSSSVLDQFYAAAASAEASSSIVKKRLNFSSRQSQSFVTILAGKGDAQEEFRVHKNVITYFSPFFDAAFNSNFIEGQTQTMTLEDIEAPIFGLFNNWLYIRKVEREDGNALQLIEYAKLWSLSQRFLIPKLQAYLLKAIENTHPSTDASSGSTLKDFQHYAYVVAKQQEDSDLKEIAVKKTLSSLKQNNIDEIIDNLPEGMLVEVTKVVLKGYTKQTGWEKLRKESKEL
ncbi:hypothetical protein N431DRAFT_452942 [Stipitochalara longipes BDJ]|nr:hypothetical protein N431DRAFT_452942 [Stipitochalara longipes BDJ]